ncbi:PREDICTED: WW domain-binding protein 11-like [Myotis brandtii]|uniref:WW domain-binding protein 11-like n=1 Tax=Myotis brandtii TaxID=109478 RepID=UPI00070417F1|nr:PREDICTED: WW domain-binding protein 11-like [Myotis brandtii]
MWHPVCEEARDEKMVRRTGEIRVLCDLREEFGPYPRGRTPALGPRPGPPPAPQPGPTRFPSLTNRFPPLSGARKAGKPQRGPRVPCSPCPANPPSPLSIHPVRLASLSSFAPHPPSGPSLASSHLDRWLPSPSPPAQSPLPSIARPSGYPASCARGQESLPLGTQTFESWVPSRRQAPSARREQNAVGSSHRAPGTQGYSRFPPVAQGKKGQTGQKRGDPRVNPSVCPAGQDSLRLEGRKLEGRKPGARPSLLPFRKASQS